MCPRLKTFLVEHSYYKNQKNYYQLELHEVQNEKVISRTESELKYATQNELFKFAIHIWISDEMKTTTTRFKLDLKYKPDE